MRASVRIPRPMEEVASVIFAAGKGTRMTGYAGNKTLLPLVPGASPFEGSRPLIAEVIAKLPPGPKGIVVNHCAEDVRKATASCGAEYIHQPETNGTGGALLAASGFLKSSGTDRAVITMGDVPLIRLETYGKLLGMLDEGCDLALLAFIPEDRAQYGRIEMDGSRAVKVTEWKYWCRYPKAAQDKLKYCNAGVYAARKTVLLDYMAMLAENPQEVIKELDGKWVTVREYFLTDLVELMSKGGRSVGVVLAAEEEVSGVDTPESLEAVQKRYLQKI
jgi:bifunctional UDP-N-acetylglucosamine pyrophosphorylase / glucosamine-1-phosphate N-acetyltransferase